MNSYLDKLTGKTMDSLFCSTCNTFKIMMMGVSYKPKCERCNTKLLSAVITVKNSNNSQLEQSIIRKPNKKRIEEKEKIEDNTFEHVFSRILGYFKDFKDPNHIPTSWSIIRDDLSKLQSTYEFSSKLLQASFIEGMVFKAKIEHLKDEIKELQDKNNKQNETTNAALEFWTEYHKEYSTDDKLPVSHILLFLNKIKKGEYDK